jgi:IS5 family transposase
VAWASTTLNLANALQYLPSAVPQQHLTEAVDLYEQVLQQRDATRDPVGSARVLANQGNALAHLGAFVDAHDRLGRARQLFAAANDVDGVAHVDQLLAGVDRAEHAAPAVQGG